MKGSITTAVSGICLHKDCSRDSNRKNKKLAWIPLIKRLFMIMVMVMISLLLFMSITHSVMFVDASPAIPSRERTISSINHHDKFESHHKQQTKQRKKQSWWIRMSEEESDFIPESRRAHSSSIFKYRITLSPTKTTNSPTAAPKTTNSPTAAPTTYDDDGYREPSPTHSPTLSTTEKKDNEFLVSMKPTPSPTPSPTLSPTPSPTPSLNPTNDNKHGHTNSTTTNSTILPPKKKSKNKISTSIKNTTDTSSENHSIKQDVSKIKKDPSNATKNDDNDSGKRKLLLSLKDSEDRAQINETGVTVITEQTKEGIEDNTVLQEFMVVTGGFSDGDWKTFPVWSLDMSHAIRTNEAKWQDWTPKPDVICPAPKTLGKWQSNCPPQPRLGHISVVHKNYLYVFSGLLYDSHKGIFSLEEAPYLYRLHLSSYKKNPSDKNNYNAENDDSEITSPKWERMLAKITPLFSEDQTLLQNMLNRGEATGGYWEKEQQWIVYGGMHVRDVMINLEHSATTSRNDARPPRLQQVDEPLGDVWSYSFKTQTWSILFSPTGDTNNGESASANSINLKIPTTFNNNDDRNYNSNVSSKSSQYLPSPRTAHAATVVGDELLIYGGLKKLRSQPWDGTTIWKELDDIWIFNLRSRIWRQRAMTPSLARSYQSLVGWQSSASNVNPELKFEQESKVIDDVILASFGGYKTVQDPISNEPVAFVFDDVVVSDEKYKSADAYAWCKASYPTEEYASSSISSGNNENSKNSYFREPENIGMISNRFEHSAVLSEEEKVMFVWGGRFQTTSQVDGLWTLRMEDVYLEKAESDDLENYKNTVAALYVLVTTMMFVSMMFTYMCGVLTRQNLFENDGNNGHHASGGDVNDINVFGRRRGLRHDVIDSLPTKIYSSNNYNINNNNNDNELAEGPCETVPTDDRPSQGVITDDSENCCPICLIDYKDGDEMRCLPCHHEFHKSCLDTWLTNNASCPACRFSLSDYVPPTNSNHSGITRVSIAANTPTRRMTQFLRQISRGQQASFSTIASSPSRNHPNQNTTNANNIESEVIDEFVIDDMADNPFVPSLELTLTGLESSMTPSSSEAGMEETLTSSNSAELPLDGRPRQMSLSGETNNGNNNLRNSLCRIRRTRRRGARGAYLIPVHEPPDNLT